MAKASAEKPKAGKAAKAEAPAKTEKAPKSVAEFSVDDVWALGKTFANPTRSALNEYGAAVADMAAKAEADPKAYREHVTAIKFAQRRVDRITLSLDELEAGIKERKPREAKPKAEAATPATPAKASKEKGGKKAKPVVEVVEDDDDEDDDDLDE